MLKNYTIAGMGGDDLDELMVFLNSVDVDSDFIRLFIDCTGGSTFIKDAMMYAIEPYHHSMYVLGMESAAFEMVADSNCDLYLSPLAYGMYHMGTTKIPYRDGMYRESITLSREHMSKMERKRTDKLMMKLNFTDKDRKDILEGKEVYFIREQLIDMLGDRVKNTEDTI